MCILARSFILSLVLLIAACGGSDDDPKSPNAESNKPEIFEAEGSAVISGKAFYKGLAPRPMKLQMTMDQWCNEGHEAIDERLLVNGDGGLKNVLVYLEAVEGKIPRAPTPAQSIELIQEGCRYIPHVLTLQIDQQFKVTNRDDTSHNFHFIGKRNDDINFNQVRPGTDELSFEYAEVNARVQCDMHPWMKAELHIFDHPYFAVTDESGSFKISKIPAGEYFLRLHHESSVATKKDLKITLSSGASIDIGKLYFQR